MRWSKDGRPVLVVANFTPVPREGYRIGVPFAGRWTEVIDSDAAMYAGANYGNSGGRLPRQRRAMGRRCRWC